MMVDDDDLFRDAVENLVWIDGLHIRFGRIPSAIFTG
jgi:hypothetical protein